mgnify:CR=1 FL=1
MQAWISDLISWLLTTLSLPEIGLSAIFIVSLVSATLLPLGSEPAVFAYINLAPDMFWPAVLVATVGNTAGGAISYATGLAAEKAYEAWREKHPQQTEDGARPKNKAAGRWHELPFRDRDRQSAGRERDAGARRQRLRDRRERGRRRPRQRAARRGLTTGGAAKENPQRDACGQGG